MIPLLAKSTVTRTSVSPLCTYIIARNRLHCKMENATNKLGINRANGRFPKEAAGKIDIDIKLWYANYIEAAAKAAFFPAAGCFQSFSPPAAVQAGKNVVNYRQIIHAARQLGKEETTMLYKAKNGRIPFPGTDMDYVRFGTGKKTLILLPGLGDGLRTIHGMAMPLAAMYRIFAKEYTVFAFSRKNRMPRGYTTRDMARDQRRAMEALGIPRADVVGISMGGMIAQHLAADAPEMVRRLVLVATCPGPNPQLTETIDQWIAFAQQGEHRELMESNLQRIYTQRYADRTKWAVPVASRLSKPKSYERFCVQAQACMSHDCRSRLNMISSPTLVMGGEKDQVLGSEGSYQLAREITGARLWMYPEYGHGFYDEAKDFPRQVMGFLME